jgi:hypothetical protein
MTTAALPPWGVATTSAAELVVCLTAADVGPGSGANGGRGARLWSVSSSLASPPTSFQQLRQKGAARQPAVTVVERQVDRPPVLPRRFRDRPRGRRRPFPATLSVCPGPSPDVPELQRGQTDNAADAAALQQQLRQGRATRQAPQPLPQRQVDRVPVLAGGLGDRP